MIIQEFSVGNYRSFKDIETLNMTAAKINSKDNSKDNNIIKNDLHNGNVFLKTKAVYGANASGKSNIVEALSAFKLIIINSVKDDNILNYIMPFLYSTETAGEPSFFQLIFWIDGIKYRYGFEASKTKIHSEWLFATPKQRELSYFIRENQKIIKIDKTNFSEGHKLSQLFSKHYSENEIFRENSLFLSSIASLGIGNISKLIVNNISSILLINGLTNTRLYELAKESLEYNEVKSFMLNFLKNGDTGIQDIGTFELNKKETSNNLEYKSKNLIQESTSKIIVSQRKIFDAEFNITGHVDAEFDFIESEGTKKLLELSPIIYTAIIKQQPIIIDEFDARLHPLLAKKIIELFNSETNSSSQLIVMTHDTNLLSSELFRRDQIEFVEKDKYGASHLYSLIEFKGVRNNASFEKDYVQGKYGAIPFLGNFNKLFNFDDNAEKNEIN